MKAIMAASPVGAGGHDDRSAFRGVFQPALRQQRAHILLRIRRSDLLRETLVGAGLAVVFITTLALGGLLWQRRRRIAEGTGNITIEIAAKTLKGYRRSGSRLKIVLLSKSGQLSPPRRRVGGLARPIQRARLIRP
jgi:hypothetical protein